MAIFENAEARRAARTARAWLRQTGHTLDKWQIEDGRPVAVCACGVYAFVERDGRHYVYGSGQLRGTPGMLTACRANRQLPADDDNA